ncbi:MAG: hypothetical protein WAQ05_08140 [Rubrivivax sp.]
MNEALLVVECLIFAFGFRYIFARDRLIGTYFFFLFLYAFPAQAGYLYFSEASVLILAYFDEAPWLPSTMLITMSAASFFLLFVFARHRITQLIPVQLLVRRPRSPRAAAQLALAIVVPAIGYVLLYFVLNFGDISWFTAQDEDLLSQSFGFRLFIGFFKMMVGLVVVLYALARHRRGFFSPHAAWAMFALCAALFVVISFRLGNRTDLLAVGLGIAIFESLNVRLGWRTLLKAGAGALGLLALLLVIEALRYGEDSQSVDLATAVLAKDYYAPAHMLFAAVAYAHVDPVEVVRSNTANALIMLGVPYLQATVTDLFRPDLATRSAGYAFYIFTEGYLFAGPFGFLYNGLVPLAGLLLWRKLASSNDKQLNAVLIALMGCMIVNVVRGQSSYFIKYLYTFILPSLLVYASLAGVALRLRLTTSRRAGHGVSRPHGAPGR